MPAEPYLRYLLSGAMIAVAVALQFVPLFAARLAPLVTRYPLLAIVRNRFFQLIAGFFLLTFGIELLRAA